MKTNIYLSRKLEKLVPKEFIQLKESEVENLLGTWSANVFYVDRKKCWIITNSLSFYSLILQDIPSKEIKNITNIFIDTLLQQLQLDGIKLSLGELQNKIGELNLFSTNNDKRTLGVQNSLKVYIEDWKYEYGSFDNWPFRELNRRINGIPYKQIGWKKPNEKMKELVLSVNN